MSKHTYRYTWQDAALPMEDGWTADVDLELTYSYRPGEDASDNNPSYPPLVAVEDACVVKIRPYDECGNERKPKPFDHALVLGLWWLHHEEIYERLDEQILAHHGEREQEAREADAEDRADTMRFFEARHNFKIQRASELLEEMRGW